MDIVIVGNGIAGITTAIEARRLDKNARIFVISSEHLYHYSRPALMYIYMADMKLEHTQPYEKYFWKEQKINLVYDHVTSFDFKKKKLFLEKGEQISYDKLVLAVGAVGNKFSWPGENLPGTLTFTSLQDLEVLERRTPPAGKKKKEYKNFRAVIVGGGLIGIEVAEMMHRRNIDTTFLVREESYWPRALSFEEGKMIEEEILEHGIDLRMMTELKKIHPNATGEVGWVSTNKRDKIDCNVVVITAGVRPNIDQFRKTQLKLKRGICVNQKFETNMVDVYACGDCAEIFLDSSGKKSVVELLWYTGRMHGQVVAENLLGGDKKYDRGIWYNSAKFFRIDYHTYGLVNHHIKGEQEIYSTECLGREKVFVLFICPIR